MTCIEFLADFAHLLITRANKEGIKDVTPVFYGIDRDGKPGSGVAITGPAGGCVTIELEHPLDALLNHQYKPELTSEIWELFLRQEKPHRFPPAPSTVQ
jgi:hypothetical protein